MHRIRSHELNANMNLGKKTIGLIALILPTCFASAQLTNVIITINSEGDAPDTTWTPMPAVVTCPVPNSTGQTYSQWLRTYGFGQSGFDFTPFHYEVDKDATFYHIERVDGFPSRVNGFPPINRRDDYSSFIAIKATNGICLTWVCASVGAFGISGVTYNWHYQIRYFSGDPNNNRPAKFEIGTIPNSGFYIPEERWFFGYTVDPIVSGVKLVAMEVNQSIQNWNNDIPLIDGKRTFVRVFLEAPDPVTNITSGLRGFQTLPGGTPKDLGRLPALKPNSSLIVSNNVAPRRTNWTDSLNFLLPDSWTKEGTLELRLTGGGLEGGGFKPGSSEHPDPMWSKPPFKKEFQPSPAIKLKWVKIMPQNGYPPSDSQVVTQTLRLEAMYPLRTDSAGIRRGGTIRSKGGFPVTRLDFALLNLELEKKQEKESGLDHIYYGLIGTLGTTLPDLWGRALNRIGTNNTYILSSVASGYIRSEPTELLDPITPHELGHTLGRPHTVDRNKFPLETVLSTNSSGVVQTTIYARGACGEKDALLSETYPLFQTTKNSAIFPFISAMSEYPPDYSSPSLYFGLDTHLPTPRILNPSKFVDVMSYCGDNPQFDGAWISSYNYLNLLNFLKLRFGQPGSTEVTASNQGEIRSAGGEVAVSYFLIQGVIEEPAGQISASILPIETFTPPSVPPLPEPGPYELEFLDGSSNVLMVVPFTTGVSPIEGDTFSELASFTIVVPENPLCQRLVLRVGTNLLASVSRSANAPTIQVLSPNGGEKFAGDEVAFSWQSSDLDGDALTHTAEISYDGGASWQMLTTGLATNSLTFQRSDLKGTTNGLFRITVSDGFNSRVDESDAPFSIVGNPPKLIKLSPNDGDRFLGSQALICEAVGFDSEDGELTGASLEWTSSLDGALGTGEQLLLDALNLKAGTHVIQVIGTASDGQRVTNTATILIERACKYELDASGTNFSAEPATGAISVTTTNDCNWTAVVNDPWLALTGATNGNGNGVISYAVEENTNTVSRTGTITVGNQTFTVNQAAAVPPVELTNAIAYADTITSPTPEGEWRYYYLDVPPGADLLTFDLFNLSGDVDLYVRYGAKPTLTDYDCRPYEDGLASEKCTFNFVPGGRWWIGVNNFDTGTLTYSVKATWIECSYALNSTSVLHSAEAVAGSVMVTATLECGWSAMANAPWLSITSGSSGIGNGMVGYLLSSNLSTLTRTGTVSVAGLTFTVVQTGVPCNYAISYTNQSVTASGGISIVEVSAARDCPWTAVSSVDWVTINLNQSSSGDNPVIYSIAANTSANSRTGEVVIAGYTLTVTQAGMGCTYSLVPTNQSVPFLETTATVNIVTLDDCGWIAHTTNEWISILSPTNGMGTAAITYLVSRNTTGLSRTGAVMVADQRLSVVQAGDNLTDTNCTYTVSTNSISHGSGSESGSFDIITSNQCFWQVQSDVPWIWFTSTTAGLGTGTVSYTLEDNVSSLSRTGEVAVAGQRIAIRQSGTPCTYFIWPSSMNYSAAGGNGGVNVIAPDGCPWTATSNDRWINLTSSPGGIGDGTVTYSVAANMTGVPRTGTITIAGETFTVVQQDENAPSIVIVPNTNALDLANRITAGGGGGLANITATLRAHSTNGTVSSGLYTIVGALPGTYGLLDSGIVLSTGSVSDYETGPNLFDDQTLPYEVPASPDQQMLLSPISGGFQIHFDVTELKLRFDVQPGFSNVFFRVVFGSEEYPEFVGSEYIDAFGLYLNGTNIAFINGQPININHPDMTPLEGTELDGVLAPDGNAIMLFSGSVVPGSTNNTLTFILADTSDPVLDTTVYISALGAAPPPPVTITLSPVAATNTVGEAFTVASTVSSNGIPLPGVPVTFNVSSGPHAGLTGNATTGADGRASFTYIGAIIGRDSITATFTNSQSQAQSSSVSTHDWVGLNEFFISVNASTNIVLNRQTGLYEQWVGLTNDGNAPVTGIRVFIGGLSTNVYAYIATGTNDSGLPYVYYGQLLNPGSNVVLKIEYYAKDRRPPTTTITAEAAGDGSSPPLIGTPFTVRHVKVLSSGAVLLEFNTTPGIRYLVEYSSDMITWKQGIPPVVAPGTRLNWVDDGPPKTESRPGLLPRFYRVLRLP